MDADTVFAIISALYFKDSWVDPLDDEDVEVVFRAPEPRSDVAMMGGFGSYGHLLSTRETTAVSWPMQSGTVAVFARSNNVATSMGVLSAFLSGRSISSFFIRQLNSWTAKCDT